MQKVEMSYDFGDPVYNPREGQACIASCPVDNTWNRAQIVEVVPGENNIQILLS